MDCVGGYLWGLCLGFVILCCGVCGVICYCFWKYQKVYWDEYVLVCSRMVYQMQLVFVLYDFFFVYMYYIIWLIEMQEIFFCFLLELWDVYGEGLWVVFCGCF